MHETNSTCVMKACHMRLVARHLHIYMFITVAFKVAGVSCSTTTPLPSTVPAWLCPSVFGPVDSESTYEIQTNATSYSPGDVIKVTLQSTATSGFERFLVRAQRTSGDTEQVMGHFLYYPDDVTPLSWYPDEVSQTNCLAHSAATLERQQLELMWRAPGVSVGDISISATIGQQGSGSSVTVTSQLAPELPSSLPDQDLVTQVPQPVYVVTGELCGVTKGCVLYPSGCSSNQCDYKVTYFADVDSGSVLFEVMGPAQDYISIGFSHDKNRGDEETVACIHTSSIQAVQRGYQDTEGYVRLRVTDISDVQLTRDGDVIACRFRHPYVTSGYIEDFMNMTFDIQDKFYLLVSTGELLPGSDMLAPPTRLPVVSDSRVDISDADVISSHSLPPAYIAHASLGLLSRLVLSALLIILTRFLKTPLGGRPDATPIWANLHRLLAVLVILLNLVGIVIMMLTIGPTKIKSAHSVTGLLTMALTGMLMGTGAALGCSCLSSHTKMAITLLHNVLGYIVSLLAVVCILLGFNMHALMPALRLKGTVTVVAWTVFHILWYILYLLIERCNATSKASSKVEPFNAKSLESCVGDENVSNAPQHTEGNKDSGEQSAAEAVGTNSNSHIQTTSASTPRAASSTTPSMSRSTATTATPLVAASAAEAGTTTVSTSTAPSPQSYRLHGILFIFYIACVLLFFILTVLFLATA